MLAAETKVKFQHSYMPADRPFGRVEKIVRIHEIILLPDEYYDCFNKVGNVEKFGIDWFVYDCKKIADSL